MADDHDAKPDNRPVCRKVGINKMSIVVEMQTSIFKLAGERRPSDTRESMIARAARAAGISYRQAKSFFYAESQNPRGEAIDLVRAAVAQKNLKIEQQASDELTELKRRIARLEMLIASAAAHLDRSSDSAVR